MKGDACASPIVRITVINGVSYKVQRARSYRDIVEVASARTLQLFGGTQKCIHAMIGFRRGLSAPLTDRP